MPIYYQGTVMYIDSITRQNFNYATGIYCDNNPQNVIATYLDADEHYVVTAKPVLRATLMLFEKKHVLSAINPNTSSAQEAGIHSNCEITKFWNRVLFTKHSDTTLKLSGKAIWYDFLGTSEQHPTDFCSPPDGNLFNLYKGSVCMITS